jgi:hypothetical protein
LACATGIANAAAISSALNRLAFRLLFIFWHLVRAIEHKQYAA